MSFITNIRSVAKYESKILVRSWFFRIFTLLAVVFLGFFNFAMMLMEDNFGLWFAKSVSSNIPYLNLLLLNTGQAVVAVFLSSEFLKRDKKLDTSEVFYVRPLSNAEYVVGKIWGNLRVFLFLNLLVLAIVLAFNFMASGVAAGLSGLFLSDQYSYFDIYHRTFNFPYVAVEEPGAHFYTFVRVYWADLVLYTG